MLVVNGERPCGWCISYADGCGTVNVHDSPSRDDTPRKPGTMSLSCEDVGVNCGEDAEFEDDESTLAGA